MKRTILIISTILFWFVIFKIYRQISQPTTKAEEIHILPLDSISSLDDIVKPYIKAESTMGLSIGIYDQGEITFHNYGICSKENTILPTNETVYEIGSITKTFTTAALVQMTNEGKVKLQDPISKYLPSDVVTWDTSSIDITLEELATHRSGLPRIPDNKIWKILFHRENPYSKYSLEDLYDYLRMYTPKLKKNRKRQYSNLGVGLLGVILASIDDLSYEEMISRRIFQPLAMDNSFIDREGKEMVTGHNKSGQPTSPWDIPTLAGAGAIKSSAKDMMKYLKANIQGQSPFEQTHESRVVTSKYRDTGLAWAIKKRAGKENIIWHNGGTGGFKSFIGFNKSKQQGVIILSNCHQSVDKIGSRALGLMERHAKSSQTE